MQNSSISHCPYGQRHTSASLLPCSSSHGVGVQERPAVTAGEPSMEFRTKASPPPQGGIQPWLPKIPPPPSFHREDTAYLAQDLGKTTRDRGFTSLHHSSQLVLWAELPKCESSGSVPQGMGRRNSHLSIFQ